MTTPAPQNSQVRPTFRYLPRPGLSLSLLLFWLILNDTVAAGHILLGIVLGVVIPLLTHSMMLPRPRLKRPFLALKYLAILFYDIIISNLGVAWLVCGPMKKLTPGFIGVPLNLENEVSITLLASTISLTPGTVSAEVSSNRCWLYVHVLHLQDEQALIHQIKTRYEQPLKEMFECSNTPS